MEESDKGVMNERGYYERNHLTLKERHHARCLFNCNPPVPGLAFSFDDEGHLHGEFVCNGYHQGYDGIVHGGVLAAIIDASMAQCLMGHGVVAYTTDMSVRYRRPIAIRRTAHLETSLREVNVGRLYSMRCEIVQDTRRAVQAKAKFCAVR
jgi:uncharacterized protein (TIGR00369 family)